MPLENTTFHFKEFCTLDSSPDADFLIHSMDVMHSLPCIQFIKEQAIDMMDLKEGDDVLEIGCGHGQDAEMLANRVGATGIVMAIDLSQQMIQEAKKRSQSANVIYEATDIFNVLLTKRFSACYADRLLVSHSDYSEIFAKIISLVKSGGKICLTDVDAISISIAPSNTVTRLVIEQIHKAFINPHMGSKLLSIFKSHDLKNIEMRTNTSRIKDFSVLSKIFQFKRILRQLVNNASISEGEAMGRNSISSNKKWHFCL